MLRELGPFSGEGVGGYQGTGLRCQTPKEKKGRFPGPLRTILGPKSHGGAWVSAFIEQLLGEAVPTEVEGAGYRFLSSLSASLFPVSRGEAERRQCSPKLSLGGKVRGWPQSTGA